ncbi:receptor-like protein 46 [Quercus suber]|uniref:Receptor-like protein 46 n=1 Tax=Quercus suber TaxID=58331 RepID=A0AAW0JE90_QUESU
MQLICFHSLLELYLDLCELESFPPSFPFVNFTSLFFLDLSSNHFNTSIPQWLFNLTSLTKLDLSYNALHSTISYDFVNLRYLEHLDLQDQNIGGQLPKLFWKFFCTMDGFLGNFSACMNNSLESLDLGDNKLETWKLEIPQSPIQLFLGFNSSFYWHLVILAAVGPLFYRMNGTIRTSIGQHSELINLNLQENSWKGVITKAQLMNLTRLEEFILTAATNQSLVFNVTYVWVPTFRLKYLELESCLISPKFPVWRQVQSELTSITLEQYWHLRNHT